MWGIVAKIVIAVVASVISAVAMTNKRSASNTKGNLATLDDFEFPQFEEGTPIMYIWGDVWAEDWMVLGVGNYGVAEMELNEDWANIWSSAPWGAE